MKATASEAVLFIFQLPTMRGLRTGVSMLEGEGDREDALSGETIPKFDPGERSIPGIVCPRAIPARRRRRSR